MTIAVRFDRVSKKFKLEEDRPRSFQEMFINPFRKKERVEKEPFWVLKNASFEIKKGESVALIGPNGAGKSTVLKMISQIIMPTSGQIEVNGRISSLLELGTGFHPDLSGRENVYLNGSMLGLSRAEINEKFETIVEFAEMERFIDLQVKHYSSGMYLRLAFAIASHVDPEILLVDEAIAVGDQAFQDRCYKRLSNLKEAGVTIFLVSHSIGTVKEHCQRAIWLQNGEILADGDIDVVSQKYIADLYRRAHKKDALKREENKAEDITNRWGNRQIEITQVELLDANKMNQTLFDVGDQFTIRMYYVAHTPIEQPEFGIALYKADGTHINGPNTQFANIDIPLLSGKGYIDYKIEALNLLPGSYEVSVGVSNPTTREPYDFHHRYYKFQIARGRVAETYGTVYLPSSWTIVDLSSKKEQEVTSALSVKLIQQTD